MTRHDVTLEWPDGRRRTVAVGPQETVLDAAQRDGIRLPYDCREGTCITCVGRLVETEGSSPDADDPDETSGDATESSNVDTGSSTGDAAATFDYRRQPKALTATERADGYVLLCIAMPRADCRVAVGPMIRAEVGDSPWA